MRIKLSCIVLLLSASAVSSQTVDVNRQNRTIEVTVSENISVDAEVADVTIGCLKHGTTHDQAYQENLRVADQVIKSLLQAGVPKENITSRRLELTESETSESSGRKGREFDAHQSWVVRVSAADAQKIIDLAVQAGANGIEDVSWDVKNPESLEAKARAAALAKARETAAEIAKSLDGRLGAALFASNTVAQPFGLETAMSVTQMNYISKAGGTSEPRFSLQLFPEKVEKTATVRVVFALE